MKFKLDKESSKRIVALSLTTLTIFTSALTLSGCNKKDEKSTSVVTLEEDYVNTTTKKLDKEFELNQETLNNTSIMLLLDLIAPEDENGKINVEKISKLKSKIDVDNMMFQYDNFKSALEQKMLDENKVIRVSNLLPTELKNDKEILSNIEDITSKIIDLVNNKASKEEITKEFNKIYDLFVNEKEITEDGLTYEVRDLYYTRRAVAEVYARFAAYQARNYITEEQYNKIDSRTNEQSNKSETIIVLEILDNQMLEVSETDINKLFNDKYEETKTTLEGKVNLKDDSIKNLVNYSNLKYLNSDKVSNKDKEDTIGNYEDEIVSDILLSIDTISEYNYKNQKDLVLFSNLLVDNYKTKETGKDDTILLDYIQYNTIMFLNTYNENTTITNNPYLENISKYFTKQEITHKYGNNKEYTINYQDISDSTNLVANEIVRYTLNKAKGLKNVDNYLSLTESNLQESIQYAQNIVMGECKKVDIKEYIKK